MSFSQDVKNEILHRKIVRSCCVTAAAYAVACFGKYFDDRGVVLQTENEGIAQLAQKLYARCGITGTVISKERGTGLIYEFSVKEPEQVQKMLNLFGPYRPRNHPAHPAGLLQMPEMRVIFHFHCIFMLRYGNRPGKGI